MGLNHNGRSEAEIVTYSNTADGISLAIRLWRRGCESSIVMRFNEIEPVSLGLEVSGLREQLDNLQEFFRSHLD